MIAGLDALSQELSGELVQPLRLGIGIHVGHAVVGRMGYGDSTYFTAVGDTVHVAARLEQATKDFDCELVVSEAVLTRASLDPTPFARHEIALRNRATPVAVRIITESRPCSALLGSTHRARRSERTLRRGRAAGAREGRRDPFPQADDGSYAPGWSPAEWSSARVPRGRLAPPVLPPPPRRALRRQRIRS